MCLHHLDTSEKKIFFIVPTVALVTQQYNQLKKYDLIGSLKNTILNLLGYTITVNQFKYILSNAGRIRNLDDAGSLLRKILR